MRSTLVDIVPQRKLGTPTSLRSLGYLLTNVGVMIAVTTILGGYCASLTATIRRQLDASDLSRAVLLTRGTAADALLPACRLAFSGDEEARFAAERTAAYLAKHGELSHVGKLVAIDVATQDIRPAYSTLSERLRRAVGGSASELKTIPLFSSMAIRTVKPYWIVRTPEQYWSRFHQAAGFFAISFAVLFFAWLIQRRRVNVVLLPAAMLLSGLGALLITGMHDPLRDTLRGLEMASSCPVGIALMAGAAAINWERLTGRAAVIPLVITVLLGAMLLMFGRGPEGSDVKINLTILGLTFQPSEVMRLGFLLFVASYLARRWDLLRACGTRATGLGRVFLIPRLRDVAPFAVGAGLIVGSFVAQKDNGPALIAGAVALVLYGIARGRFLLALSAVIASVLGAWVILYQWPERMHTVSTRVALWRSPWDNNINGGTQIAEGLWAYASGGLWGTGIGRGYSRVIPNGATDLITAVAAENLGFPGTLLIVGAYAAIVAAGVHTAIRARSAYQCLLATAVTLAVAAQTLMIACGVLGLIPLSGVSSPLLSYGRTSLWINFVVIGILAAVSHRSDGEARHAEPFRRPMAAIVALMTLACSAVIIEAARYHVYQADEVAVRQVLTRPRWSSRQDNRITVRNPRFDIVEAERGRGDIIDTKGIIVASDDIRKIHSARETYKALGIDIDQTTRSTDRRHYPFGNYFMYLTGDLRAGVYLNRQLERAWEARLKGFSNYAELLPLIRHPGSKDDPQVRELLARDRDLHLTLDARFQVAAYEVFQDRLKRLQKRAGAFVVLDPSTGSVLASGAVPVLDETSESDVLLYDRDRAGVYPIGSTGKLLTLLAGLAKSPSSAGDSYACARVPGGSGVVLPRYGVLHCHARHPHGRLTAGPALKVSCNAYFAQYGVSSVGPEQMLHMGQLLHISVARHVGNGGPTTADVTRDLARLSFGQGEMVATPLQVAQLPAIIANQGVLNTPRWTEQSPAAPLTVIRPESAAFVAAAMHGVLEPGGTGAAWRRYTQVPAAAKTGSAERADKYGKRLPTHSWFAAFAPYSGHSARKIAMAVVVEEGGFGVSAAMPAAADIMNVAERIRIIH